jgi:hypothetical protein
METVIVSGGGAGAEHFAEDSASRSNLAPT